MQRVFQLRVFRLIFISDLILLAPEDTMETWIIEPCSKIDLR